MENYRPAWAEVDLSALAGNVRYLKSLLQDGVRLLAVVKADAYGHGAIPVSRAALGAGADWLGVATVEEGLELRRAGVVARILVLAEPPPGAARAVVEGGLTPTVYTPGGVSALGKAAAEAGVRLPVHLKVDTGMRRVGVPSEAAGEAARFVLKEPHLELEGVFTHFAVADDPFHPFLKVQVERFRRAVEEVRSVGADPPLVHAANSAATLARPDLHFDMVRPGLALYGVSPAPGLPGSEGLRPVLSLKARVVLSKRVEAGEGVSYGLRYLLKRPARLVTVPLGYADGVMRAFWEKGEVLIRGRRWPVAGVVCMDLFMVDVGEEEVEAGEEVVVIGSQGGERIDAWEHAAACGTIPYEVLTRIGPRVPRVYLEG